MDISAKQIEALKQSTEAIVKYLDNISVAIIGTNKNHEPKEICSGTCIKIKDSYFIATAAHCMNHYKKDDLFLIHSKSPKERDISINNTGFRGGGDYDLLDIGWLELTKETIAILQKEFIELKDIEIDFSHVENDFTFVSGFPRDLINKVKENKLRSVKAIGYLTNSLDPNSIGKSDNKFDIFFDYPEEGNIAFDNRVSALPNPEGISGGGFWSVHINTKGVWSTQNIKLVGIDRGWCSKERWIIGIQINNWLAMIIEDFPMLEAEIKHYFPKLNT